MDEATAPVTGPRTPARRLDLGQLWAKAQERIRDASGGKTIKAAVKGIRDPVQRARAMAEVAAPADMRAAIALTLGAEAEELEQDKSGARLILETARWRLGTVGLRAGEVVEHDVSERMRDFMSRFYSGGAKRRALPERSDDDERD